MKIINTILRSEKKKTVIGGGKNFIIINQL